MPLWWLKGRKELQEVADKDLEPPQAHGNIIPWFGVSEREIML